MYTNCYSAVQVTDIEEVKSLIERFYKKSGRLAEAAGAEEMLMYLTQRDSYNADLEMIISGRSDEIRTLRDEKDKIKQDVDRARRELSDTNARLNKIVDDCGIANENRRHLRRLLSEAVKVKGFSRAASKKLREEISKAIERNAL